ncbi:unnamed protein product [Adineta steineri]|uniref:EGF-like domain-containing protein n=1 Tax=Adineta steineri TaxID=433720 RepID=A0A814KBW6_9BILA|nr:unnamed protein product [Adineta steineri]CAF1081294.1 unnamed protein product [Adineta steineri]
MSNLATTSMTLDCSNSNINIHELKQSVVNKVFINVQSKQPNSCTCLCPLSYYGNQCQFQNQHLSLAIKFHVSGQLRQIPFIILI